MTYTQLQNSGGEDNAWQTVDGYDDLFAFDFGAYSPTLFLIKTGNHVTLPGEEGTFDTFLFSNTAVNELGGSRPGLVYAATAAMWKSE